jgi:sugar phosphate isomerase/epimerase
MTSALFPSHTPTRRRWMKNIACAALTAPHLFANVRPNVQLGAQTNAWPVDPANFGSFLAALGAIQRLGFRGFETGYRNLQTVSNRLPQAKDQISVTGLIFFGVHIFLPNYDSETRIAPASLYEGVAKTGKALGAQRLILSGAPAAPGAETAAKAAALNRAGAYVKGLGLTLAYHNHAPEFEHDGREMDDLIAHTDPEKVEFLLDVGHAARAGADLSEFIYENHDRIIGLHFRDTKDGREVPLGQGDLPLAEIAEQLRKRNWHGWALAEEERRDGSKPGEAAVGPAYEALRKAFPQ